MEELEELWQDNRWQDKLVEEFPFMTRDVPGEKKNIYQKFGFECLGGWYEILRECCQKITDCYERYDMPIDIVPTQIKEKFGTLRFYYGYEDAPCGIAAFDNLAGGPSIRFTPGADGDTDDTKTKLRREIAEIVREAEEKSAHTCEWCGKEGMLRHTREYRVDTVCDTCFDMYQKKAKTAKGRPEEYDCKRVLRKVGETVCG